MYRVLITARSYGTADALADEVLVGAGCEVVRVAPDALGEEIGNADAVIAGLEPYTSTLLESATRLKVISRYGVGYDAVDLTAATARGIVVTNTPGANGESVADLAIALMMSAARNIPQMHASMAGHCQKRPSGVELWHKTVGVLGTGRIGQAVARRCSGFGMRVLAHDAYPDRAFADTTGATYVDFDTLISESDFITIHLPLNDETRNIVGAAAFQAMKPDTILVNTARGGIIDESALFEALQSRRIRGAALDVTAHEPADRSPLLQLDNCILTPHAGAATVEASSRMSLMAAINVVDVLTTGTSACKVA